MGLFDIFKINRVKSENELLSRNNNELKEKIKNLEQDIQKYHDRIVELGVEEYEQTKEKIERLKSSYEEELSSLASSVQKASLEEETINDNIISLMLKQDKIESQLKSATKKLAKTKELYKSMEHSIDTFFEYEPELEKLKQVNISETEELAPTVMIKLHYMDVKELRSAYKENERQIENLLKQYSVRYTTKANQSIYQLMVIALKAELQNILFNLKYEKLETSIDSVKKISQKYLDIAAKGNQSIAVTLTKFIGEIEYLFINAVKIEYNYYVKKEQARQEQLAIKEQMRQEAEERKALENEKKKVEQEENKFINEIDKLNEQLNTAGEKEIEQLKARILELQGQLSDVIIKKEEISNLQNGKAGNVYIISNLGSFGNDVFKIGMTRRIDPQDRINELGSASVPFKFDVHSFIFSDDAVGLEKQLHTTLNDKRLNKINLRKEFFRVPIDELEELVQKIDPTAEFNKTMLAEEFHQSIL